VFESVYDVPKSSKLILNRMFLSLSGMKTTDWCSNLHASPFHVRRMLAPFSTSVKRIRVIKPILAEVLAKARSLMEDVAAT
jgi:hypothetical protein